MSFTPYQIITPLISLVAIFYAWNLFSRQKKTLWEAVLWSAFWAGVSAIAVFPDALSYLTAVTGVQDRENAVFVTAIGILFLIVFYLIMRLEQLEQRQTRIVRKLALRDADIDPDKEEVHQES